MVAKRKVLALLLSAGEKATKKHPGHHQKVVLGLDPIAELGTQSRPSNPIVTVERERDLSVDSPKHHHLKREPRPIDLVHVSVGDRKLLQPGEVVQVHQSVVVQLVTAPAHKAEAETDGIRRTINQTPPKKASVL